MQIEKIVATIRASNIGNVLYKTRPAGNYLGVFGLKRRPPDENFLETGTLEDIGFAPVVNQAYKRFRKSIPKDFVIITYPEAFSRVDNQIFTHNQFQLVDLDLYTYLITIQAITNDKLGIQSSNYSNLFYLDGRLVDYSKIIHQNMFNYSFILTEYSSLMPYIYKKKDAEFFADEPAENILFNFNKSSTNFDIEMNFDSLQILSNIANLPN